MAKRAPLNPFPKRLPVSQQGARGPWCPGRRATEPAHGRISARPRIAFSPPEWLLPDGQPWEVWEENAQAWASVTLLLHKGQRSTLSCLSQLNSSVSQALQLPGWDTIASQPKMGHVGSKGGNSPGRGQLGQAPGSRGAPATSGKGAAPGAGLPAPHSMGCCSHHNSTIPVQLLQPIYHLAHLPHGFCLLRFCSSWHLLTCPLSVCPLASGQL